MEGMDMIMTGHRQVLVHLRFPGHISIKPDHRCSRMAYPLAERNFSEKVL
jgi:hypothetical protein